MYSNARRAGYCSPWLGKLFDPVVVFFALTDRASTIPSNTRGCQSACCKWKSESGSDSSCSRAGVNITPGKCFERVASTFVLFLMRLEYYEYLTARGISTIIYSFDLFRLREVVHESATFNEESYVCVCMVITYSRLWINRVRLPSNPARGQLNRKKNIPLSP